MRVQDLRAIALFDGLSDGQLRELMAVGEESVARQREALVALGTLAAGLAHEINNPAAAATRAVDALQDTSESLLSSLGRLVAVPIPVTQFVALDELRREIAPPASALTPLAIADREDDLSDWLVGHGVERPWLIATPFAAAGIDVRWCDRAAALLDGGPLEPGLQWVANSLSMATLLAEVKESTGRISDLVAAVRSYSQLDRAAAADRAAQAAELGEGDRRADPHPVRGPGRGRQGRHDQAVHRAPEPARRERGGAGEAERAGVHPVVLPALHRAPARGRGDRAVRPVLVQPGRRGAGDGLRGSGRAPGVHAAGAGAGADAGAVRDPADQAVVLGVPGGAAGRCG